MVINVLSRAKKIPVAEKEKKKGRKSVASKSNESETEKEKEKESAEKTDGEDKGAAAQKKKRKIRLDMHLEQIFLDSQDAYVWLYDPIPWYYWLGGSAIVLSIIAGKR